MWFSWVKYSINAASVWCLGFGAVQMRFDVVSGFFICSISLVLTWFSFRLCKFAVSERSLFGWFLDLCTLSERQCVQVSV